MCVRAGGETSRYLKQNSSSRTDCSQNNLNSDEACPSLGFRGIESEGRCLWAGTWAIWAKCTQVLPVLLYGIRRLFWCKRIEYIFLYEPVRHVHLNIARTRNQFFMNGLNMPSHNFFLFFCVNVFWQILQVNDLSFSWTVWICPVKPCFCVNVFWQILQRNGFAFSWTFWICLVKHGFIVKALWDTLQKIDLTCIALSFISLSFNIFRFYTHT